MGAARPQYFVLMRIVLGAETLWQESHSYVATVAGTAGRDSSGLPRHTGQLSANALYRGELFSSITHLMGTVLAAAGAAVLVVLAARQGDPWKIVSFSIYGVMLLALYTL